MTVFKKHLASPAHPKNTSITVHKGKGASDMPLGPSPTMNNYAKATPMANPQPTPPMAPPSPAGEMPDVD